jgi:hypothetical protein
MNLIDKKPNFFILGAAKAGTTSLYEILAQHPQVYFPFDKEPAYFCDDTYYSKGDKWYLNSFFKQVKEQPLRGEATSRYLYFASKVAPRIKEFVEPVQTKYIVIFRDPAKLVYSFYWNSVREGHETLPFIDALKAENGRMIKFQNELEMHGQILYAYSRIGAYARQVQQYLEYTPKDQFLFLLTEDLTDHSALIHRLQVFLELEDHSSKIKSILSNSAALPRNQAIHHWLRKRSVLKDIVKPFIPSKIRYKLKMSALERNLKKINPPDLDEGIANDLRKHYREETINLQDIIQRDLTKWLPS